MARTLNGNLTGAAARTERLEILEKLLSGLGQFMERYSQAAYELERLDPDGFEAWYDSYPKEMTKGEFLPLMLKRIEELKEESEST